MATITLKNIPDDLYARLKHQARAHRRSINSELIHCLEGILRPRKVSTEKRLERIRSLRAEVDMETVNAEEVLEAIDQGRP